MGFLLHAFTAKKNYTNSTYTLGFKVGARKGQKVAFVFELLWSDNKRGALSRIVHKTRIPRFPKEHVNDVIFPILLVLLLFQRG